MNKSEDKHRLIIISSFLVTVVSLTLATATVMFYGDSQWSAGFADLKQCELYVTKFHRDSRLAARRARYVNAGYAATLLRADYQEHPNPSTGESGSTSEERCQPCCTTGPPGPPGRNGQNGHNGKSGKGGEAGKAGKMSIQPCSNETIPKCDVVCLPGPSGLKGSQGPRGDPGSAGKQGKEGHPGNDAAPGGKGSLGRPGTPGSAGEMGDAGMNAVYLNITEPGNQGPPGPRGLEGPTGPRGFPAEDQMLSGAKGMPGVTGPVGKPGREGNIGAPGMEGPTGNQGICPTYCAVDGGVFHDPLSIVSNGNYDQRNGK